MVRGLPSNRGFRNAARGGAAMMMSPTAVIYPTGRGGFSGVWRSRGGRNGYFFRNRFGVPRGHSFGENFYQFPFSGGRLRQRSNVALDRRRRFNAAMMMPAGGFFTDDFAIAQNGLRGTRGRRRGGARRGGGPLAIRRGRRGQRSGFRGAGRSGRRNRGVPPSEADLNAQLDAYMGDDATKSRLDSQLDAYFGRASGVAVVPQEKTEPLSDPTDVSMTAPTSLGGRELVV